MGARSGGGAGMGSGQAKGLSRALRAMESAIRYNDFETMIALDDKGNILFNKKGGAHSVSYGTDGPKTANAIVTHNHPSGASFSPADIEGMVFFNQKEMRATGKEYTYSMKRPEKGWGVSSQTAEYVFKQAITKAKRAYATEKTGNPTNNRKLWLSLTDKYVGQAASKLGWNYSRTKNK